MFYTRDLLAIWEQVYGWDGVALSDGQELFVGFRKKMALGTTFYSLPFGWYGGFLGGSSDPAFKEQVFAWLQDQRFIDERIVQMSPSFDLKYPDQYQRHELTTHVLDLSIPSSYSENTLRNVRKSQQQGLVSRRLGIADIVAIDQLRRDHIDRTGEERRLSETFYAALYILSQSDDSGVTMVGAFRDDSLLALHFYFVSPSDVFYFDGYASAVGLELAANFFLFDLMISRSRDFGRQRFNFGASPETDEGLKRFKAGWGAQPVTYHEYHRRSFAKRIADMVRGRP